MYIETYDSTYINILCENRHRDVSIYTLVNNKTIYSLTGVLSYTLT